MNVPHLPHSLLHKSDIVETVKDTNKFQLPYWVNFFGGSVLKRSQSGSIQGKWSVPLLVGKSM